MSAWGIGAVTAARTEGRGRLAGGAEVPPPKIPPVASVDTLVSWIPGEVIAAYAAIVLALQPEKGSASEPPPVEITSGWWIVVAVVFAVILTWLGGWTKVTKLTGEARKELVARVVLAGAAFAIWSLVIPGSAWYSLDLISDNQTLIPILAGIVGASFGLFAEGLVRRLGGTVAE